MTNIREYAVDARSTDTFGRVLCNARQHHFIIDGPVQNGCPGEALTPPEAFFAGVASCGVELIQVIAKEQGFPLTGVRASMRGIIDKDNPVRTDCTVFNSVEVDLAFAGVTRDQAEVLVEAFKGR